jgi:signal transduction histidine kinase/ligand-binding sensor domain-containing protein
MGVKRVWPVVALMISSGSAAAQGALAEWHHTAWTGESGPPIAGEHLMQRSPDGYLWLSAPNSLIRFDGMRFTVIDGSTTPALRTSLPGEFVPALMDSAGVMWIRGPGGTLVTYLKGRFERVRAGREGGSGILGQDARGLLWLSSGRLSRIKDAALVPPDLPGGVPDTGVFGVVRDTGAGLWIGTETQGLWHVSGNVVRQFGDGRIRPLLQARDGSVWAIGVGLGLGLWRLHDSRWSRMHLEGVADDRLISRAAMESADGSVWFQTPGMGVMRWRAGLLERYSTAEGLSDNRTHDVLVDPHGATWITTDAGVDRLRPSAFIPLSRANDLPYDSGYEIEEDRSGALWGAAPGSRLLYLLDGGAVRNRPDVIRLKRFDVSKGRPFRLLAPARGGGIWVAPLAGGIALIREDGKQIFGREHGLPRTSMVRGLETRDGSLWLTDSAGGFGRLHGGRYAPLAPGGVSRPDIRLMLERVDGELWAWSAALRSIIIMRRDSLEAQFALGDHRDGIAGLVHERGDTVWASTRRGVVRITGRRPVEVVVPSLGPLLAAGAALAVAHEQLWLANATGIARISLADLNRSADGDSATIKGHVLDALDGLPFPRTSTTTPGAIRVSADGRLWVSTPNGIYVTDGSPSPGSRSEQVAHIEEVLVSDVVLPRTDQIKIPANPDRVTIRFSAPNLFLPERTRVQYRLDGADDTWIEALPPRIATYTQLRPGSYEFRVRAWSENGVPSERESRLQLSVTPAWYETWLFVSLCAIGVLGMVSAGSMGLLRYRTKRANESMRARFEAVLDERARIARELHDTLLQGFTGITLHLEALRGSVKQQSDSAAKELSRILETADSTLREAREMVWDMRSPQLADADLSGSLEESARHLLNGDDVELHFSTRGLRRRLPPLSETTVLRVGREALFNALKHGAPKSISVQLLYEPRRVTLEVLDDGHGADPQQIAVATTSGHWGIAGMQERAARASGTLDIVTAPGKGMLVRLTLPAEPIT